MLKIEKHQIKKGVRFLIYQWARETEDEPASVGKIVIWGGFPILYITNEVPEGERDELAEKICDLLNEQHRPNGVQKNKFGLDCRYFDEKLKLILRDIKNMTPTEFARAMARLSVTSDPSVISQEPEFTHLRYGEL
jgi:hypothetical protein